MAEEVCFEEDVDATLLVRGEPRGRRMEFTTKTFKEFTTQELADAKTAFEETVNSYRWPTQQCSLN